MTSILPLWATRHLPLVDYPAHASTAAVLATYGQDEAIRSFYEVDLAVPYVLIYLPWVMLAKAGLGVVEAGRMLLAMSVLAVPLGFAALLRARRRPPGVAVFAIVAGFGTCFRWGFVPNQAAIGLTLLGLALHAQWLRRPGVWTGLATAMAGLLIAGTHVIPLGVWGLVCGVLSLFQRGGPRVLLRSIVPLLPAGALLLAWTLGDDFSAAVGGGAEVRRLTTNFARSALLPRVVMGGLSLDHGYLATEMFRVARLYAVLAAVTWGFGILRLPSVAGRRRRHHQHGWDPGLLAATGALVILYREVPDETAHVFFLWERLGVFIFLLGLAGLPHLRVGVLRRLLLGIALFLSFRMHGQLVIDLRDWARQHEGALQQVLGAVQPDEVIAAALTEDYKPAFGDASLWHLAHWSLVERGALVPFGANPYFPVQTREGPDLVGALGLEARSSEADVVQTDSALPDLLLVARAVQADEVLEVPGHSRRFRRVLAAGEFWLYRQEQSR
ncbi:hypothetical protein L6R53_26420 [Myxococcota bacterium]|nr:hypothetical protein [Myxococcota bacterium]